MNEHYVTPTTTVEVPTPLAKDGATATLHKGFVSSNDEDMPAEHHHKKASSGHRRHHKKGGNGNVHVEVSVQ